MDSIIFKVSLHTFRLIVKTLEASLLNIFISNYILFKNFQILLPWEISGFFMLLGVDFLIIILIYSQFRFTNMDFIRRDQYKLVKKFFFFHISDQNYDKFTEEQNFLKKNYNLWGFLKKLVLFIVLVALSEHVESQLYLVEITLGLQLLLSISLRTYKTVTLNIIRILSDLSQTGYFVVLHICWNDLQRIMNLSKEEKQSLGLPELQRRGNYQLVLGYVGFLFQLFFCILNMISFALSISNYYQDKKNTKISAIQLLRLKEEYKKT